MATRNQIVGIAAAAVLIGLTGAEAVAQARGPLLVIPASRRTVQLAFDVVRLRNATLVSYQKKKDSDGPLLHTWDAGAGRWVGIDMADLEDRRVGADAGSAAVIGYNEAVIAPFADAVAWAGHVEEIPSMNLAVVANGLDTLCGFTPREWRWLAGRYELDLKDLNEERRRYGRYGPPGGRRPAPATSPEQRPAVEPVSEPVAPVMIEPVEEEKGAAAPAVEPVAAPPAVEPVESVAVPPPEIEPEPAEPEPAPEDK